MARLIVQMQTSIDGFVDSDDPASRWQLWDWGPHWPWSPDLRARFNSLLAAAGGILLSRPMATEGYLDHWRQVALEHPTDPDYAFAAQIGRLPKIVVSSRTVIGQWPNTSVIEGTLVRAVAQARQAVRGDLVCFGGAGFVTALLRQGLVDELELYINPGLAGRGKSIFRDVPTASRFTLLDATPTDCGVVVARWGLPPTTRSNGDEPARDGAP